MTVSEIRQRLAERRDVLGGSGRGRAPHHRTLRTAIQWSYELLSDDERALLDLLSVFPAWFTSDAAEQVCPQGAAVDAPDTVALLSRLVDRAMLTADTNAVAGTRYRLLQTIRAFAAERLDAEQLERLRSQHLRYYLHVVEEARADFEERDFARGRETLTLEWDNFRDAARTAITTADRDATARLHRALHICWMEELMELGHWALAALDAGLASPDVYGNAAAFVDAADETSVPGERGEMLARQGLSQASAPDDPAAIGCWKVVLFTHQARAEWDKARSAAEAAYRASAGERLATRSEWACWSALLLADPASSRERLDEAVELARLSGNPYSIGAALMGLGHRAHWDGQPDRARADFENALLIGDEHHLPYLRSEASSFRAQVAAQARHLDAAAMCIEALRIGVEARFWFTQWRNLDTVAFWWVAQGQLEAAATLLSALDANRALMPARSDARRELEDALETCPEAASWQRTGAAMDRHAALQYAIQTLELAG